MQLRISAATDGGFYVQAGSFAAGSYQPIFFCGDLTECLDYVREAFMKMALADDKQQNP